ncbi:DsrE family protein [Thiobacillus sedimenti]|uniref:DsrE family protein n=1 Tax=Thiobacillus sedimenti TaxID=3110231 RepID=A0ABZ1CK91_9PROT|nr:DsrE family protein [Thiobacillus sp. SCUT-2]WRS38358.1 DsrE family protein [Thiobacillus sp. SCUT-2]
MKHTLTHIAPLVAALMLGAAPAAHAAPAGAAAQAEAPVKVVYHINDASVATAALHNVNNELNAAPNTKVVVVAHGKGIDFLLNDAKDGKGNAYEPEVAALKARGVSFRVCHNTLQSRHLNDDAVIMEAEVVPSGVAEVARLQAKEGYVYIKP